jgi:hypothetical protein
LKTRPDVGQESLYSQMEKLIIGPFKATDVSTLIIIDALDGCRDGEPASAIMSVLSFYVNEIPNVKFFVTRWPEPHIHSRFRLKLLVLITEVLELHEVKLKAADSDIKSFFRTRPGSLAKQDLHSASWTRNVQGRGSEGVPCELRKLTCIRHYCCQLTCSAGGRGVGPSGTLVSAGAKVFPVGCGSCIGRGDESQRNEQELQGIRWTPDSFTCCSNSSRYWTPLRSIRVARVFHYLYTSQNEI